ncbi:DUF6283 family protein [Kitasatospora viridis]|uniref:Uncharacterized protein n=1 Tax=Kitasatospora viridis TaxID=281105 RepID=A0A561S9Z8_9ACTN|nr:DUF6283 family protein [Kitasatospora viridis]TWF71703.1 hypothetical protein FHX73_1874 [Kitasatospora viridis]
MTDAQTPERGSCSTGTPHRRYPCNECPWKRETEPGQFTAERYELLRNTSEQIEVTSMEDIVSQPMFACHKSPEGDEEACAGWLAVEGHQHIGIRLAVATGRIPAQALRPGEGWPELFDTFEEMAERQGAVDG